MSQVKTSVIEQVLAGGGEMGALMRTVDWSKTLLGPVEQWPQSLRTAVSICLSSRFPILIWWGPDMVMLYNDAYRPMLGANKHPGALGQRGRECWPEIWHIIGPMLEGVLSHGEATWSNDQMLPLERYGYTEETYFTFSYSPIRDENSISGIFTAVTETTQRVLGERRLRTLRELGARASEGKTATEAGQIAAEILALNPADVPFALLYLLEADDRQVHLAGAAGVEPGTAISPPLIKLADPAEEIAIWPLAQVVETGQAVVVDNLPARTSDLPPGPWPEPSQTALALPIAAQGQHRPTGVLIAGVSSRRALDDDYRGFFELVAGHIATAVASARAYEAERQRAEALAELDRAKTAFFSNISHEFRTPLTLMLGPLEDLLAQPGTLSPQDQEQLEVAHRNSLRLLKLVNTLLDFSRLEAGRIEAVYEPTDLATFTAELAGVFRSAVERAGLKLSVNCQPLAEPVYVDREMWEKIVLNLLSNALKFTLAGEIEVTLRQGEVGAELAVRDTGTGIPAEEIPHLFERFHRVKEARGRTFEGSGIGLALVQELVKLHGGGVRIESEVDRGSTFIVSVPFGKAHLPADRIGAARVLASTGLRSEAYLEEALRWLPKDGGQWAVSGGGLPELALPLADDGQQTGDNARILLADDNADMRDYLRRLLGERYEVEAVGDGLAALAAARQRKPDLVLTDVMMPVMDGFELLRRLRAEERTREVPVILLSARAGEESRVEGLEAGADDYLIKPFSTRELLARVEAHLKMARVRREAAERERALRREAEEAQALLHTLLEYVPEGITIVGGPPDFPIKANSALAEKLLGRPSDTLLGMAVGQHIEAYGVFLADGKTRPTPEQMPLYRASRLGETVKNEEWVIVRPDGSQIIVLVDVNPIWTEDGQVIGAVNCWRDITDRKQLATERQAAHAQLEVEQRRTQALYEETERIKARLERILAGIKDDFVMYDHDWRYVYVNDQAAQTLGYPKEQLIGQRIWDLFPNAVDNFFYQQVHWAVAEGREITFEFYYEPFDRWFENRAYPIADGLLLFSADISERKQWEAQREQLLARLEAEYERLETILQQTPAGVVIAAAPSGETLLVNEHAKQLTGYGFEVSTEIERYQEIQPFQGLHADGRPYQAEEWPLSRAVRRGEVVANEEIELLRADGSQIILQANATPIRNAEGEVVAGVTAFVDITAQKQAEQALRESEARLRSNAERIATLQAITARLSEALTPSQVARVILDHGLSAVGASAALIASQGQAGADFQVLDYSGYSAEAITPWRSFPAHPGIPMTDVVQSGQPLFVSSGEMAAELYPALMEGNKTADTAWALLPLKTEGGIIGGLSIAFAEAREFSPDERDFMLTLARQCAQALERARLYEAETIARTEAETAGERLGLLVEASSVLIASTSYETALADLVRLIVPRLADWCVVDAVGEDGLLYRLAVVHRDPAKSDLVEALQRRYSVLEPNQEHTITKTLNRGQSWFDPEVSENRLAAEARDAEHLRLLQGLGFASEMVVPLVARGQTLGTLTFVRTSGERRYKAEDLFLAEELARRAAIVVDNIRLYEAERAARAEAEASQQRLALLAEMRERNRMAQELHDTVAQALGYLNLKIGMTYTSLTSGHGDTALANLQELKQVIGETYTDVREEIFNLRAKVLSGLSFMEVLSRYIDKYRRFYNLDIS
ncbi:MAG: GAF domain-containing protein [Anaerolineae bacterium]|nr:GAF domain-containing protein [Anaerolineae bacterium]